MPKPGFSGFKASTKGRPIFSLFVILPPFLTFHELGVSMETERVEGESPEVMLPGFRFHPTDEELVGFYLRRKIQHKPLSIELIKQLDIYKYDPWDLPSKK